jgi:hypothetical protein
MALDLYLMSMYLTGHAGMALDSYVTSMYLLPGTLAWPWTPT